MELTRPHKKRQHRLRPTDEKLRAVRLDLRRSVAADASAGFHNANWRRQRCRNSFGVDVPDVHILLHRRGTFPSPPTGQYVVRDLNTVLVAFCILLEEGILEGDVSGCVVAVEEAELSVIGLVLVNDVHELQCHGGAGSGAHKTEFLEGVRLVWELLHPSPKIHDVSRFEVTQASGHASGVTVLDRELDEAAFVGVADRGVPPGERGELAHVPTYHAHRADRRITGVVVAVRQRKAIDKHLAPRLSVLLHQGDRYRRCTPAPPLRQRPSLLRGLQHKLVHRVAHTKRCRDHCGHAGQVALIHVVQHTVNNSRDVLQDEGPPLWRRSSAAPLRMGLPRIRRAGGRPGVAAALLMVVLKIRKRTGPIPLCTPLVGRATTRQLLFPWPWRHPLRWW
ncbi:NADH-cytochrome b5 reductase-like protein [Leishmania tarentolae]|uniref:NADH-cytochrome b5 reductase-like protein n=1 Tax=Leishmania tarentolae TaxID=5689 RepID=A0A640KXN5_LEITA|nr:NADH-cytochrome b5 reductase-like protein [Leishmania tarentolae]